MTSLQTAHFKRPLQAGFTLIEILIATLIFAMAVLALVQTRSYSLKSLYDNEAMRQATMLAQAKMAEYEMKIQYQVNKNGVPGSFVEESGVFEAPFEKFHWKVKFRETTLKSSLEGLAKLADSEGDKDNPDDSLSKQQKLVISNFSKLLLDNFGELFLEITWEQYGRNFSLPLLTHIIPLKPKISIQMSAE